MTGQENGLAIHIELVLVCQARDPTGNYTTNGRRRYLLEHHRTPVVDITKKSQRIIAPTPTDPRTVLEVLRVAIGKAV